MRSSWCEWGERHAECNALDFNLKNSCECPCHAGAVALLAWAVTPDSTESSTTSSSPSAPAAEDVGFDDLF